MLKYLANYKTEKMSEISMINKASEFQKPQCIHFIKGLGDKAEKMRRDLIYSLHRQGFSSHKFHQCKNTLAFKQKYKFQVPKTFAVTFE